jgi:hypothetical protein
MVMQRDFRICFGVNVLSGNVVQPMAELLKKAGKR